MASVSSVVPVYNSEGTLEELADRIRATLDSCADGWELILVNDGSADSSWERIAALAEDDPRVRGIDLSANFGQHNALLAGIRDSRYELIVTLDDDLQNPPEEIPKLLGALAAGSDVVYGFPLQPRQPFHRRAGGIAMRTMLSLVSRSRAPTLVSGFRGIRATVTRGLGAKHGRRVSLDTLLRRATDRITSVEVRHDARRQGRSNYTLPMLMRHGLTSLARNTPGVPGPSERGLSYAVRRTTGEQVVARSDARR